MSRVTIVVRDRPLALGGSHQIQRCDGKGPKYIISEGGHYIMTIIRSIIGMYASRQYNIYADGVLVANSGKLGTSQKQLVFRPPDSSNPFATAFLQDRHWHGNWDMWF